MNLFRKILFAFGYEITRESKSPSLHSHLANIFNYYRIDTVLDVGANRGQFAMMLRNSGYRGTIYSFEPVTASFKLLEQAAKGDDRWHVFKLGLGDFPGYRAINISQSSDLCSLLAPNDFGRAEFPRIEADEQETIQIDTVDNFLVAHDISSDANIFLKMDTQGYDVKVFKGAMLSLDRISCMLSELSLIPIYEGMPHYLASLDLYEQHGFQVSGLYPVSRNRDYTIVEMDCVMVNKNY